MTSGTVTTRMWSPLLLMILSHCTGRGKHWRVPSPHSLHLWEQQPDSLASWAVASVWAAMTYTDISRSQGALPSICWTTTQTQAHNWDLMSPAASLSAKMPPPIQGFCSSLHCKLMKRLTIAEWLDNRAAHIYTDQWRHETECSTCSESCSMTM